jgi:hypothetical protein
MLSKADCFRAVVLRRSNGGRDFRVPAPHRGCVPGYSLKRTTRSTKSERL